MSQKLQLREPMRSKLDLMNEFDDHVNGAKLRFEIYVDIRDIMHETRIQQARKNKILEEIAQNFASKPKIVMTKSS